MLEWIENNAKTAIIAAVTLAFIASAANYVLQHGLESMQKLGPAFERLDSK
ncbi:hypothetical protein ACFQ5D_09130 [Paenibacillus farraposensis]|uniref:Uncharacterized protein n=1 Tax=Paenibacillus farraposensis TaxID=2807095 RepID=A0ABW4DBX6_9BACL|nr:hypothetical protein [Paenibacillus farraposensis]MCC3379918.1 hypothetical protein [Paenibacillus farraposensis]